MPECQVRTKLVGKRTHRVVLRTRGDAQACVALLSRLGNQSLEENTAKPLATDMALHAERDLWHCIIFYTRRVQFRRSGHEAILDICNNYCAVGTAPFRVAFDETLIGETVEAIAPAFGIEPQQMLAK